MLNQYRAQRQRGGDNPHGIGTVAVGSIIYIQDRHTNIVCRNPWIVEAWHNREYHPATRGSRHTVYMVGGHLATVRSLRTGQRRRVADHRLLAAVDAGLEKYPPDALSCLHSTKYAHRMPSSGAFTLAA